MSKKKISKKEKEIIIKLISLVVIAIIGLLSGKLYLDAEKDVDAIQQNNIEISQNENYLEINYIDVGQADSILIRNKDEVMLIDAGNNEDGKNVVNFIKEKGISKINYLVGTHPHSDHIGGLDDVIKSDIEIENVFMPKIQTNTKTFEDVLDALKNKNLKVTAPKKGDNFKLGDTNCEIMTDSILDEDNLNLSSIVIKLTYGEKSFLFMGDAETENEKTINWPRIDVLKVGHHGSNTSSSQNFLNQIKPEYAIIMVGKDNTYGLPKEKILDRLKKVGAKIYRTDELGTITIICDGNSINIK